MKILIINWQDIKHPLGGGAEVHLHEIFKRIVAKGHEVTLLCCRIEGEMDDEIIDGIKIVRRGNRNTFNYSVPKLYKKNFLKEYFDIVIDDVNKIPFYTPLYIGRPIMGISHHFFGSSIYREANLIAGLYVNLAEWAMKLFYDKTYFSVVSQSTLDEFIQKGYNPKFFRIITNAIEHKEYPMKIGEKYIDTTITYFGRLKKYKSIDNLIHSFARLKKDFPKLKLIIMGRGDFENALKSLAKKLNVEKEIHFTGFVDDRTKIEILSKSHLVVNTSMKEGWGITNIEANACGTPVISANSPGLRDSIKDGQSGLLYQYNNIDDLTSKIKSVLDSPILLEKLSNGAIEWAKTFSWDKSADETLEYMQFVIEQHNEKIKSNYFEN